MSVCITRTWTVNQTSTLRKKKQKKKNSKIQELSTKLYVENYLIVVKWSVLAARYFYLTRTLVSCLELIGVQGLETSGNKFLLRLLSVRVATADWSEWLKPRFKPRPLSLSLWGGSGTRNQWKLLGIKSASDLMKKIKTKARENKLKLKWILYLDYYTKIMWLI